MGDTRNTERSIPMTDTGAQAQEDIIDNMKKDYAMLHESERAVARKHRAICRELRI